MTGSRHGVVQGKASELKTPGKKYIQSISAAGWEDGHRLKRRTWLLWAEMSCVKPHSSPPCTRMALLRVYKTGVCGLWGLYIFAPGL